MSHLESAEIVCPPGTDHHISSDKLRSYLTDSKPVGGGQPQEGGTLDCPPAPYSAQSSESQPVAADRKLQRRKLTERELAAVNDLVEAVKDNNYQKVGAVVRGFDKDATKLHECIGQAADKLREDKVDCRFICVGSSAKDGSGKDMSVIVRIGHGEHREFTPDGRNFSDNADVLNGKVKRSHK